MTGLSLQGIAHALGGEINGGQVLAPGPGHTPRDRSMAVRLSAQAPDGFVVHSFAEDDAITCKDYVRSRLGLEAFQPRPKDDPVGRIQARSQPAPGGARRVVALYDYTDEHGELLKQAVRYEPKGFGQRRPDPDKPGGWLYRVAGVRNVPYQLPALLASVPAPVFVVEGEKDADRLRGLGMAATTNIGGAGNWTAALNTHFAERIVYILADNDEAGASHAAKVAASLAPVADEVRVVALPGLPDKGDVSDWLDAGGTADKLMSLCEAAPVHDGNVVHGRFAAEPVFDPWEAFAVPDFPAGTLPPIVAEFVAAQSSLIGCDLNGLAMASIAAMGGALNHRFGLKVMRHGSWWASPRLWVLLAGDPSRKKTPVINATLRELEAIQAEAFTEWSKAVADHKAAGGEEDQEPPRPPRYVIGDTTTEKLGEILSRQDRGLLVKRDELSGWIGSMERYSGRGGGASDRAFWLQAYDGGHYTIDRVNRGERLVTNLSVSLVGGIQPERLAEMHDLTTDGLLQRFVPVMLRASRFPIDAPEGNASAAFGRLIRSLSQVEPNNISMDDAALLAFEKLRRHIFDVEQASSGLAPGFQAFAGKLPGMAASIALILHMAAHPQYGGMVQVEPVTIEAVRRIVCDFILPHAFEFYRSAESTTNGDRLKRLASWILTCGKDRIVVSDLATNVAGFRGLGLSEVAERLSPLVATGWLEADGKDPIVRAWKVLPAVRVQMAERRREEEARKAALAVVMRSPRKNGAAQ